MNHVGTLFELAGIRRELGQIANFRFAELGTKFHVRVNKQYYLIVLLIAGGTARTDSLRQQSSGALILIKAGHF